ncbi:MAG: hypothetical protein H7X80_00450 [bacterium]|nr:hypothetical protein [Candidatus Kapabacteria bacterium]
MSIRFGALLVMLVVCANHATAQIDVQGLASKSRIDLAVPEAPAFMILGLSSSQVMRPGTLREIAITATDFFRSGDLLPESFSTEFAPRLLADAGDLSLADYRSSAFLYRLRVSLATSSADSARHIALGLRVTLIDDTDLRTDDVFTDQLRAVSAENRARYKSILDHNAIADNQQLFAMLKSMLDLTQERVLTTEEQGDVSMAIRELDESVQHDIVEALWLDLPRNLDGLRSMDSTIDRLRERRKKELWNNSMLELGFAARASSFDSTVGGLWFNAVGAWGTYALPVGSNGNLLIGANTTMRTDSLDDFNVLDASLATRFYWGMNEAKALVEVAANVVDAEYHKLSASAGGELNFLNGFWLEATAGVDLLRIGGSRLKGGLSIRIGTPE